MDALPEHFDGFIVGNEVLDAMPCALVYRDESGQLFERGVVWREQGLAYEDQPCNPASCSTWPARWICRAIT